MLDGLDIKRSQIGYIGQESVLCAGSIFDNISYGLNLTSEELTTGRAASMERAIAAAQQANAATATNAATTAITRNATTTATTSETTNPRTSTTTVATNRDSKVES